MIVIDSCEKLRSILLPTTLIKFTVRRCRELKTVAGIDNLTELTDMCIDECPELEKLPILAELSCLKIIVIDFCEKLQSILLPTTLIKLTVRRCRELKMVAGTSNLTKLTDMCIGDCPELEELPFLTGLSCLKTIVIDSCEKLQSILLPTTLINLTVRRCRELKMVAGIGNLAEPTDMFIGDCPELEEMPNLAGVSCLESISIDTCEKLHNITLPTKVMVISRCPELEELPNLSEMSCLESIYIDSCERMHNITPPTTLIKLRVQGCRELSIPGRLSYLKSVIIESCERLKNIQGIEELQALETIQFLYCSNAAIQDCVPKLKHLTSSFIQVVGRAADGAKPILKPCLLSEAYFRHSDIWRSPRAIIILCGVVGVSSSAPVHTINESFEDSTWKFNLRQGESIITMIITHQNYGRLHWQYNILSKLGIMKKWCVWGVKKGGHWRISHALTTIIDKLHQK